MTQLKQTIANYDDELHDGNYINADKDKKMLIITLLTMLNN